MRTTLRPAVRSLLIASTELVLGPMVQIIAVLRRFLDGLYSVSSWLSHSILVPPSLRCFSAVAILDDMFGVVGSLMTKEFLWNMMLLVWYLFFFLFSFAVGGIDMKVVAFGG